MTTTDARKRNDERRRLHRPDCPSLRRPVWEHDQENDTYTAEIYICPGCADPQEDPGAATRVTEWGVRWGSVFVAFSTETAARAYVLSRPHGERVLVSRTRITFPDLVTDWQEASDG